MAYTKWVIDPIHSEIGFKIKHLMIANVSGRFDQFEVDVQTEGEDFTTAKIEATINAASINTGNAHRDEHLKHFEFFEVDKHPQILFVSTKIEKIDNENFVLHGNLSLKGITKPLKLKLEYNGVIKDPWGGQRAGFIITGKINRNEFEFSFNSKLQTGALVIDEEVKISCEVQLVKQVASVAA